jgi:hypothetical protein
MESYNYSELSYNENGETCSNSPVTSVGRAVHAALCTLHHIFWLRKAASQTYTSIAKRKNV